MAQLLDIFAFASVILRGLTLASEALVIGGVIFMALIARSQPGPLSMDKPWWFLRSISAALVLVQCAYLAINSSVLMATANLTWAEVRGANFCLAGGFMILGAAAIGASAGTRFFRWIQWPGCLLLLAGSVMTSHSLARLDYRWPLAFLTLAHHLAGAAWIGGLPYLVWTLRKTPDMASAERITARFSRMALISVPILVLAGVAMSALYVGSPGALVGTTYGIMLVSKVMMTALVLSIGGLNLKIVRAVRAGSSLQGLTLSRFSEVEVGIGFTIILAAASLTSAPPAIDVNADRVTLPEIAERVDPDWPLLQTPALAALSPVTPLSAPPKFSTAQSLVPGQSFQPSSLADIAWSEYNHHWAGLVVLTAGALALLARRFSWGRHWPLAFLGLAVFLFLRADAENWPLGPRGFWESFQVAEVAQHRIFVLLIVAFGLFEWSVRTGRCRAAGAALVFPLVCALSGALLITHSHSLGNVKEEFLAELSHLPIAFLGVVAGWARWLEIRLPEGRGQVLGWIWPICFVLIGCLLLNYREA